MRALRIWAGLVGPPLAWVIQMALSESMASYACYPHDAPLAAPLFAHLPALVIGVDLVCLLIGLSCSWITLGEWRNTGQAGGQDGARVIEVGETRQRFLVMLSALSCSVFVVAILFTSFAILLVNPCKPW
jgi:hypothetical protein